MIPGAGNYAACPPIETLDEFCAGSPPAAFAAHLEFCGVCRKAVREMRADHAFLARFRAQQAGDGPIAGSAEAANGVAIPGYEQFEEIHRGGQGIVYRARQLSTGQIVAIKVIRGGAGRKAIDHARFEREVRVIARLRHPNIVVIHDSGTTAACDYYVMDLVSGVPLDEYVRRRGLDADAVLKLFAKVCDAVNAAHLQGVIHRDLKPGNILVDSRDEPCVLDFGIAKFISNSEAALSGPHVRDSATAQAHSSSSAPHGIAKTATTGNRQFDAGNFTLTGQFLGSLPWASPEQVGGPSDQIDLRTDVYSLGVLLFQVLTGRFPYRVDGPLRETLENISAADPPRPSSTRRGCNDEIDAIVLKCLAKDRGRRYQSAGELYRDIDRYLRDEPIEAKRDSAWYMIRGTLRRNRRKVFAACGLAAAVLLASAALLAYRVLDAQAVAERARALAESERAEARALLLRSAGMRALRGEDGYAKHGLHRLQQQLWFGWLSDNRGLEYSATLQLAEVMRESEPQNTEQLVRQATSQRRIDLGRDHPDTVHGAFELAEILLIRGRSAEAAACCSEAITRIAAPTGESLESARGRELLARILLKQGDAAGAADQAARAVETQIGKLGPGSIEQARSLDTWSAALLAGQKFEEAEARCLDALRLRLTLLVDEHPDISASLHRLALILESGQADGFAPRTLKILGKGERHATAAALRRLAEDLAGLPEARGGSAPISVMQNLVTLKEAFLGKLHRGQLSTLASLAYEAIVAGDLGVANTALEHAQSVIEKTQGMQSLAMARCLEDRSRVLESLGCFDEALEMCRASVDVWWSLPTDRRDDFQAAANERYLALLLAMLGHHAEAEARCRHCMNALEKLHGPGHFLYSQVRAIRAWALASLGRVSDAECEARAAIEAGARMSAPIDAGTRYLQHYFLGSILIDSGKLDEAEWWLQSAWEGEPGRWSIREAYRRGDLMYNCFANDMRRLNKLLGNRDQEARWQMEDESSEYAGEPRR